MASSKAATVEEYIAMLPPERGAVLSTLRELILRNLPEGYAEAMAWGMIVYGIPLERYPDTYNGQPLGYVALAAQKEHFSLYLMGVYGDPAREAWIRDAFREAGKKLDMGKSCVRFRTLEELPLDSIAQLVASVAADEFIALYERSRATPA